MFDKTIGIANLQVILDIRTLLIQMASHNEEQMSDMEIEMVKRVHSNFPNGEPSQFHYFYATASPFSNFHPCSFTENGISFDTSEKYMMFHKARKYKF